MPVFRYTAITSHGVRRQGRMRAADSSAVTRILRDQGLWPVSVDLESVPAASGRLSGGSGRLSGGWSRWWGGIGSARRLARWPERELAPVLRELALLVQAGQPLDAALRLSATTGGGAARLRLAAVVAAVQGGIPLAQALRDQKASPLVPALVDAGENSGTLGETLARAAELLERRQRLRQQVMAALSYPLLVVGVAGVAMGVLLAGVIPQIAPLLADQPAGLSLPTRLVLATSAAVTDGSAAMGLACGLAGGGLIAIAVQRFVSPLRRSRLLLTMPILGPILRQAAQARFVGALGMLLRCGVPLVPALGLATPVLEHRALMAAAEYLHATASRGQSLAGAAQGATDRLAEIRLLLSPLVLQSLRVGEEAGRLDAVLIPLAGLLEERLEHHLKRLLGLLEPVVLLVLSLGVGLLMLAVFSALLAVNEQVF